jgi:hypothetical protein
VFPSRMKQGCHLNTRQYARLVDRWCPSLGSTRPPMAGTASDEGRASLQEDRQPSRLPAPPWAYQTRKHREVPWRRGR